MIIRLGVHLTLFCLNVVTSQQLQNFVWKGYKKLYNWSMRIKGGVQPHCPTVQKGAVLLNAFTDMTVWHGSCGQQLKLDDAAEFTHQIVMVSLFRNVAFRVTTFFNMILRVSLKWWVGGPLCFNHSKASDGGLTS